MTRTVAVIGAGPRGLNVVERLLARHRDTGGRLDLLLFDPRPELGSGVHEADQPDYLLANTVCSQLTAFSDDRMVAGPVTTGPDLFRWAADRGVHLLDFRVPGGRRPVAADDFLPRALLAEYLRWAARRILADLPPGVSVRHVTSAVTSVEPCAPAGARVVTGDGDSWAADLAVVTTGHGLPGTVRGAYPLPAAVEHVGPGATVAVLGTGLTAMDAVAALTVGRGGEFGPAGYRPSGREPRIVLVNRSGWLPCARPSIRDGRPAPAPLRLDPAELAAASPDGRLDLRRDVEPVLRAEMLRIAGDARTAVDEVLTPPATWPDRDAYARDLVRRAGSDLAEAEAGLVHSSYKQALEVLRDHREVLRAVAEHPRLSAGSRARFYGPLAALVNRCAIGPQKERIAETLALIEAGVVTPGPGPAPAVEPLGSRWRLRSTRLDVPASVEVDHVLTARTGWPVDDPAAEPVTWRLRRHADPLPLDRDGVLEAPGAVAVAVLGPPAEGTSYYNHYVVSPGTPSRALADIDRLLDRAFAPTAPTAPTAPAAPAADLTVSDTPDLEASR